MKKYVKADSGLNDIILKFKGRIYYDGHRDAFDHILFGENKYEYIPAGSVYRESFVIIHDSEPTSTGYQHTSKKSTAKVEIISE